MHKATLSQINLSMIPFIQWFFTKKALLWTNFLIICSVKLSFLIYKWGPTSEESPGFLSYEQIMASCLYVYLNITYGSRKGVCCLNVHVHYADLSVMILIASLKLHSFLPVLKTNISNASRVINKSHDSMWHVYYSLISSYV